MFKSCEKLEKIYVGSKFDTSNVTSADDAFLNCDTLIAAHSDVEYDNDKCLEYIHEGTFFTKK